MAGEVNIDRFVPGALAIAQERKRNAIKGVKDALVELRVANRKLREIEGKR